MKYKVGDIVRIKSKKFLAEFCKSNQEVCFTTIVPEMVKYGGREVRICKSTHNLRGEADFYRLDCDNERWIWHESWLEPIKNFEIDFDKLIDILV